MARWSLSIRLTIRLINGRWTFFDLSVPRKKKGYTPAKGGHAQSRVRAHPNTHAERTGTRGEKLFVGVGNVSVAQ